MDAGDWPALERRLEAAFAEKTREEWEAHFAGRDACVTPVLTFTEATRHPHNRARGTFVEVEGIVQPAPAPRFSRTPSAVRSGPTGPEPDPVATLDAWGVPGDEVLRLVAAGAVRGG
jgi:alpha-methylacyl-CoA racemase